MRPTITPFFSVVIPTYNRAKLLVQAVESVLRQDYTSFEIIVVDNCSTDATDDLMQAFSTDTRVTYLRNSVNLERGHSRNRGYKTAKGLYACILDSDDIMYPSCLRDAHHFACSNRDKLIFHPGRELISHDGAFLNTLRLPRIVNQYKQICQSNFLSTQCVFVGSEIYTNPAFHFSEDPRMVGSEDYDIWIRILARYSVGRIPTVGCGLREHTGRSVYTSMYENLEYQRMRVISMIETDPLLLRQYREYLGYINANYFWHEAMYSLSRGDRRSAWELFVRALADGRGMFLSRRSLGFLKNFLTDSVGTDQITDQN